MACLASLPHQLNHGLVLFNSIVDDLVNPIPIHADSSKHSEMSTRGT